MKELIVLNRAEEWNNKGVALYLMGEPEEAIKCYNRAIELDPKNIHAWISKGGALDAQNKYEEAIKCYDKAIELDPKNETAIILKKKVLKALKQSDD